jgi:hypothetical protein
MIQALSQILGLSLEKSNSAPILCDVYFGGRNDGRKSYVVLGGGCVEGTYLSSFLSFFPPDRLKKASFHMRLYLSSKL